MTTELMPEERTEEAKEFVMRKVGLSAPASVLTAIGFMDKNKDLLGAFVFERCTGVGGSVYVHWAANEGLWLSRAVISIVMHYVFVQLECAQLLGEVRASDKYVRDVNERIGFNEMATITGYFPGDDLVIYSMRRDECIWLAEEDHEDG